MSLSLVYKRVMTVLQSNSRLSLVKARQWFSRPRRLSSAPSFVFSIRGTSLASLLSRLLPSVVPSQSPVTPFTPPNNETKRFLTSHFLVRSSVGRVHLRIPRERCPRVLSHGHGLLLHRSRSTVLITPPPLRTHANNKFATIGGSRINTKSRHLRLPR